MPDKEKHHTDRESAVNEQIDRSIRDLRKELTALRGKTDTASVEKVQELRFQIKHLEAARSLPRRQRENTSPEASVRANRSLTKTALGGFIKRHEVPEPAHPLKKR